MASIKRQEGIRGGHQSLFSATCCLTSSNSKMNSMILVQTLLAATCVIAAPAGHHFAQPLAYAPAPAISYAAAPAISYAAAPAVTYTAHVQVPITKTVHYESRPVVTGYQTSIIKPAIAAHAVATPVFHQHVIAAPVVAAPAPAIIVAGDYLIGRQDESAQPSPPSITIHQPTPPAQPQPQPTPPQYPGGQPTPPPGVCLIQGAPQPQGQNIPPCPTQAPQPAPPAFPAFPAFPNIPAPPPPQNPGQNPAGGGSAGGSQSNPPESGGGLGPSFPGYPGGLPAFPSFPGTTFIQGVHLIPEQKPVEVVEVAPAPAPVAVAVEPVAPAPVVEQVQSDDTAVIENPEFKSAAPAVALAAPVVAAPALTYAAAPVAVAAPVATVAVNPAFTYATGPLVTQEKVLAPVRTHTQITPQVTQVEPEVTVRKVIHDVAVATPVGYAAPAYAFHGAVPAINYNTW